jgi:hypothetical protein
MAVQNYDYYPIVDPDTSLNEQQEKLTAEQFEKNKQKLLSEEIKAIFAITKKDINLILSTYSQLFI